jgi:hypothetical protein
MSSSMENRPEPLHLRAVAGEDGGVFVTLGNGGVISDSTNYVRDAIRELRLRGHDPKTHVVIHSVSGNPAWNGSIEQHHP